jgi:hypothetical protein
MSTRLGLFDGRLISLFPRRLVNTARSATMLQGTEYATYLENLVPNDDKAGSGAKRFGLGTKGNAVASTMVDLMEYRLSSGLIQIIAAYSDGTLRTLNEGTGAWTTIKSGLSANGLLCWTAFNEKLIISNGIDQPFSWNGTACVDLGEFVEDFGATAETQVSTSQITLVPLAGRSDYAVGQEIQVQFATAGIRTGTITTITGTTTLTITVSGTPFPSPNESITKVFYYKKPPAFSFIFAEHARLWALSAGESKARDFRGVNGLKVFYTETTNNENTWYNQSGANPTQELNFVDITNRARRFDELIAISSLQGVLAFHGRLGTYLYRGDDPTTIGEFVWEKTIPVGTLNARLVQMLAGDVIFCTQTGLRSLQKVFQTESLEVVDDVGSDIESTISEKLRVVAGDNTAYRAARSFAYARDGLYGFRFDTESLPVRCINEESQGWTFFTGLFKDATAFLGISDGRLLVGVGGQLYAYGNGTDTAVGTVYSDNGAAYRWVWQSPWMQLGQQRWANKAFEVLMEEGATGAIYIDRFVDYNMRNTVTTEYNVVAQGAVWDVSDWDVSQWDGLAINPVEADKFLADTFRFTIRSETANGPFSVLGVRPIGR